jgi:hypothetical protein
VIGFVVLPTLARRRITARPDLADDAQLAEAIEDSKRFGAIAAAMATVLVLTAAMLYFAVPLAEWLAR